MIHSFVGSDRPGQVDDIVIEDLEECGDSAQSDMDIEFMHTITAEDLRQMELEDKLEAQEAARLSPAGDVLIETDTLEMGKADDQEEYGDSAQSTRSFSRNALLLASSRLTPHDMETIYSVTAEELRQMRLEEDLEAAELSAAAGDVDMESMAKSKT